MVASSTSFAESKLQTAIEATLETNAQARQSQQHIDEYVDDSKDMLYQYRVTLRKLALMGVSDVKDLHPGLLEKVPPVTPAHVLSAFPLLEEGF